MEEFAKMIYTQWRDRNDIGEDGDIDWEDYDETVQKIYDFLNEKLASDLECAINSRVWKIEENAFIVGFGYACKCLSDGKIELKGGIK